VSIKKKLCEALIAIKKNHNWTYTEMEGTFNRAQLYIVLKQEGKGVSEAAIEGYLNELGYEVGVCVKKL